MEAIEFERYAQNDPQLSAFLQQVAQDAAKQSAPDAPQRFITGAEVFISLAAYALYRLMKGHFDLYAEFKRTELLKRQVEIINALVEEDKIPPEQAKAIVESLLNGIKNRADDDSMFKTLLSLFGRPNA